MSIKLTEDFCEDELVDVYMRVGNQIYRNGLPMCDEDHDILGEHAEDFVAGKVNVFIYSRGMEPSEEDLTINPDGAAYVDEAAIKAQEEFTQHLNRTWERMMGRDWRWDV